MRTIHELKTTPMQFDAVRIGQKTFEVREDDRDPPFKSGDLLILREWAKPIDGEGDYTGQVLIRLAGYVYRLDPAHTLAVISLLEVSTSSHRKPEIPIHRDPLLQVGGPS